MSKQTSFISLPKDINDPKELELFFRVLIEKLDILFNNRGDKGNNSIVSVANTISGLRKDLNNLAQKVAMKEDVDAKVSKHSMNTINQLDSNATLTESIDKINEIIEQLGNAELF